MWSAFTISSIPFEALMKWKNGNDDYENSVPLKMHFAYSYEKHPEKHSCEKMKQEESQVKKRVLLHHISSPFVLVPLLFGATSLAASWTFDWKAAGIVAFAGIAGLLAAGGIFLTRLVLRGEATAAQVLQELDAEAIARRERKLDLLESELESSDEDPRPEKALRDLRALIGDLRESTLDPKSHQLATIISLHASLSDLFEHCVELLEQTITLWQTAERLSTPAAKRPILEQREVIIADIQKSVEQVSHTLVGIRQMGTTEASSHRLKQMREELDRSLSLARNVDKRVDRMMRENGHSTY